MRHGNTKVWRRKSFKDMYQVTEIVVDNAGVGQMSDDIAEWTGMKINEVATAVEDRDHWRGIYAPPTLLMEEGTERRRCVCVYFLLATNID